MKFPIMRMLGMMSVVLTSTVQAGYYQLGATFGDDTNQTISADAIPVTTGRYAPTAKDGSGTWSISSGGTIDNALYVREGVLEIKEKDISLQGYHTNLAPDGYVPLSVAGKDSTLSVDGAKLSLDSWGAAINVGGVNGSGSLILKNGAKVDNWNGFSCFIGYPGYVGETNIANIGFINLHAVTSTTEGDVTDVNDRYVGKYYQAANGYNRQYGRGYVEVTGKSHFEMGSMGALFMAEGTLLIDDHSSVVTGTESKWNEKHESILGRMSGCTSKVEIKDGSTLHIRSDAMLGHSQYTNTQILVDNSTLKIEGSTYISNKLYDTTQTNVKSSVILQNHAVAELDKVVMGNSNEGNTASVVVDSTSHIKALGKDSCIKIQAEGATLKNSGTVAIDTYMSSGDFIALNNSSMAALEATGGAFSVSGSIDVWGDIALTNAEFIFADGAVIDLNGNDFTFGEGSSITIIMQGGAEEQLVMLADEDSAYAIRGITFNNAGSVTGLDGDIEVKLLSSADADPGTAPTVILSADKVTVNNVPEPATATLSLLALAGLCARRRRK